MFGTSWNPFCRIIETKTSPHARTLRSTFLQKLSDTFFVFSARQPRYFLNEILDLTSHSRVAGLFDYATLFIPKLLAMLSEEVSGRLLERVRYSHPGIKIPIFILTSPIFLLNFLCKVARLLSAGAFTLLSIPLVILIHGFAQIEGRKLKEELLTLSVGEEKTFGQSIQEAELDLEDIKKYSPYDRIGWSINDAEINAKIEKRSDHDTLNFSIKYGDSDKKLKDLIKKPLTAMLKLNIGNITETLESYSLSHQFKSEAQALLDLVNAPQL